MEITLNFVGIVLLLGIIQGLGQMLLLVFTTRKEKANWYLVILLGIATFILLEYFVVVSNVYLQYPFLVGFVGALMLGIGPTLYLYSRALLTRKLFRFVDVIHFFPVVLSLVLAIDLLFLGKADKIVYIERIYKGPITFDWSGFIYFGFISGIMVFYLYMSRTALRKYHKRLKGNTSDTNVAKLGWLRWLLKLYMFFILSYLFVYVAWTLQSAYTIELESFLALALCSFIFSVGYFSMMNGSVFQSTNVYEKESKYKTSALTKQVSKQYLNKLLEAMTEQKPYLKQDLKLNELSDQLSIPSHQLSQIINQELGLNFFDFVNQYRVNEAEKRLLDDQYKHLTILGIALECGFSNKVTFNRIFKKFTGLTPSAYIKREKEAVNN